MRLPEGVAMTRTDYTSDEPLTGGHWERVGMVMVWRQLPDTADAPLPTGPTWTPTIEGFDAVTLELRARNSTDEALRRAHAAWNRGERYDPLTIARNREWERRRGQRRRNRNA